MRTRPLTITKLAAAAALALAALAPAAGAQIPNTGPGSDPVAGFGHVAGAPSVLTDRLLASPFDPGDATPAEAAAADALWSDATPENDLGEALDAMASAGTASAAADARQRALDILEGNPIAKKAYSGIPLLNFDGPSKVKTVPAGGTVTVTQVRWGEHVISDTWLLDFADPSLPFHIKYRVAELGVAIGGELDPTPLLRDGSTPAGGQHSAIQPLGIDGNLDLGTHQGSRFTDDRALGDVPEQTRRAVEEITVDMPPPGNVSAILDPNLRPGHETATTLLPATAGRVAAARAAMDFQGDSGDKARGIARLADASPEKQIWTALHGLDPAAGDFLTAAHAAGTQNRDLVSMMRSRAEIPAGVVADGTADATVVLQNNEAYLSRGSLRLAAGASLRVQVVNRDGFSHHLTALDLHNRARIFGAWDWGKFDWSEQQLVGGSPTLAAGDSRTYTITPAADAFTVWIGDLDSGDQANASIALDRSPHKQEALKFGAGTTPIHSFPDVDGNVWVTLAGVDSVARIIPSARLADSKVEKFPLPGGRPNAGSAIPPLAPSDVTIDGHGIAWVTLASGNAIARIDPAKVTDGTSDGIQILKLDPCPVSPACLPEIPPIPNEVPTRRPTRLKTMLDGQGNTVLWFNEAGAASVGVMRVDPAGKVLNQAHYTCACVAIESIDLGPDGSVWFAEINENRIGRLRPDVTRPFSPSAARLDHYNIPSAVDVPLPGPIPMIHSSLPFSVAVDGRGRVWFSESSLSGIAYLEPDKAKPGTSAGFTELHLPHSDFRSAAAPADVAVDRANHTWWTGEYGDQIEQLNADDSQGLRFRGSVRRGLTEGPIADRQGNLWVVESGGNLINRISGVTSGPLVQNGVPAGLVADTTTDALTGVRLRDTTSVDVTVERAGATVARATAPVSGGEFSIGASQWDGTADALRADDKVHIQPSGPFARAELVFTVASLSAAVDGGSVTGEAKSGGQALADRVEVDYGSGSGASSIDAGTGRWKVDAASPLAADAGGTVAWEGATVAATFRTITHFGTPAAAPQGDAPADTATPGDTAQPTPLAPRTTPKPRRAARSTACARRQWLHGTARAPKLLLLGLTSAQLETCLGQPSVKAGGRWRYGRGLTVTLRGGRVTSFTLTDRRYRSSRGGVGVGSTRQALRALLPALRRNRVRLGSADIRVTLDARGRVRRITVSRRGNRS